MSFVSGFSRSFLFLGGRFVKKFRMLCDRENVCKMR